MRVRNTHARPLLLGLIASLPLTFPFGEPLQAQLGPVADRIAAVDSATPHSSDSSSSRPAAAARSTATHVPASRTETAERAVEPVIAISKPRDYNSQIYYKNRLEFSLESGWLDQNVPFPFDFLMGGAYNSTPLNYTLAPIIASLRWQMNDVSGLSILRGNWDATFTGMLTPIPRGPETVFAGYAMGIRRNFVPHNFKLAPYFEFRAGTGRIDAKGPKGVVWAQGQNFVFTLMMGSGFRYNVTPRYSFSAGVEWMHISNLYMSEPKFANYGINVYGPMFGIDVHLGHRGVR